MNWLRRLIQRLLRRILGAVPDELLRSYPSSQWKLIIPPPDLNFALELAHSRLSNIQKFFQTSELQYPTQFSSETPLLETLLRGSEFLERTPVFSEEYLEQIPGIGEVSRVRFDEGSVAGAAQAVRLMWQARGPELALAERFVDTIISIRRTKDAPRFGGTRPTEYPTIRLEKLDERQYPGKFPWVAIIETNNFEPYSAELERLTDWLGIGVAVAPPRRVLLLGACQAGVGLQGSVGGGFQNSRGEYLATCAHVLSANCQSVVLRGNPSKDGNEPDAALIKRLNPCFKAPSPQNPCLPATELQIQSYTRDRKPVQRPQVGLPPKFGLIRNRAHGFDMNGAYQRFPHLEVVPLLTSVGPVTLPIWDQAFSKEGDSGSWVLDVEAGTWFGMVVGADQFFLSTFVAEAEPLLSFFSLAAISEGIGALHSPFSFN